MLTKKDYGHIAKMFTYMEDSDEKEHLLRILTSLLIEGNPNFNEATFREHCQGFYPTCRLLPLYGNVTNTGCVEFDSMGNLVVSESPKS